MYPDFWIKQILLFEKNHTSYFCHSGSGGRVGINATEEGINRRSVSEITSTKVDTGEQKCRLWSQVDLYQLLDGHVTLTVLCDFEPTILSDPLFIKHG